MTTGQLPRRVELNSATTLSLLLFHTRRRPRMARERITCLLNQTLYLSEKDPMSTQLLHLRPISLPWTHLHRVPRLVQIMQHRQMLVHDLLGPRINLP